MAEAKGPTLAPNKMAISRALGAAFLSHQVQQLEKTVSNTAAAANVSGGPMHNGGRGKGYGQGSWRERKASPSYNLNHNHHPHNNSNDNSYHHGGHQHHSHHGNGNGNAHGRGQHHGFQNRNDGGELWHPDQKVRPMSVPTNGAGPIINVNDKGRIAKKDGESVGVEGEYVEDKRRRKGHRGAGTGEVAKDADVVVVDASVLVHALGQVKKWCREGRGEVVIVPLEALNTLDLLKKGTSTLAQRARAASRILEAQVGTNSRIRVQQDDAFVLWDKIPFQDKDGGFIAAGASPEWVRRTICCARWEVERGGEGDKAASFEGAGEGDLVKDKEDRGVDGSGKQEREDSGADEKSNVDSSASAETNTKPRIVLAVLADPPESQPPSDSPNLNPNSIVPTARSTSPSARPTASPIPLPLSTAQTHAHRHEPRSAGTLVKHWAARAGIAVLEVTPGPSAPPSSSGGGTGNASFGEKRSEGRGSVDEDRESQRERERGERERERGGGGKRGGPPGGGRGRRNSHARGGGGGGGMVERPPAVMAMMELVAQPSRVVRVLARGEKLDP